VGERVSDQSRQRRTEALCRAWARRALGLYPRAWRRRYADEVAQLLSQHRVSPWTVLDIALGALDAHLHADLLPEGVLSMTSRLRSSAVAVWYAFAAFVFGYLVWGRSTDPRPPFDAVAQAHPEVNITWTVAAGAADIVALAILVGGAPILFAAIAGAWRGGRRDILALIAWPAVGIVVCGALLVIGNVIGPPIPPGQRVRPVTGAFAVVGFLLVLVAFITFVGGTISVAVAVRRSALGARVLRFAVWPAAVAVLAMAVSLVSVVVWSVLLWRDDPRIHGGVLGNCAATQCYGPTSDIGVGSVIAIALPMAVAVLVGVASLRRAFSASSEGTAAA
jgi:hypothetical protein